MQQYRYDHECAYMLTYKKRIKIKNVISIKTSYSVFFSGTFCITRVFPSGLFALTEFIQRPCITNITYIIAAMQVSLTTLYIAIVYSVESDKIRFNNIYEHRLFFIFFTFFYIFFYIFLSHISSFGTLPKNLSTKDKQTDRRTGTNHEKEKTKEKQFMRFDVTEHLYRPNFIPRRINLTVWTLSSFRSRKENFYLYYYYV